MQRKALETGISLQRGAERGGGSFTVKDSKRELCKNSISLHGSDGKLEGELLYWDLCKICKTCHGRL